MSPSMRKILRLVAAVACIAVLALFSGRALYESETRSSLEVSVVDLDSSENSEILYYGSLDNLSSEVDSKVLHLGQGQIGMSATIRREDPSAEVGADGKITVSLHKVELGVFDHLIGSIEVDDSGFISAIWPKAEAGDYYIRLSASNAADSPLCANDLQIWSIGED